MEIYTYPAFLSHDECAHFRQLIDENKQGVPFTDSGKFQNKKWINLELAQHFYNKLQLQANKSIGIRPNNFIMSGKYIVGDQFGLHTDTGLFFDTQAREKTNWTLLIYLGTSVPSEEFMTENTFVGGETIFFTDEWEPYQTVTPCEGMAVLFDISIWHQAKPVFTGVKYWIGCEIIGKMK